MPGSRLQESIARWQKGDGQAFAEVYQHLWEGLYPTAVYFLRSFADRDQARDFAADAFWAALEEMDLKVSGGRFLTDPIADPSGADPTPRRGRVSGRKLSAREPLAWMGEREFQALFRKMWIARGRDTLQSKLRPSVPYEPDQDDRPAAAPAAPPETSLWAWVEGLAQVAEQLRAQGQGAAARLADALIRYLQSAGAEDVDFGAAWDFVQQTLDLTPAALYQGKRRFFLQLADLPAVPRPLQEGLGLFWLREMRTWSADCAEVADRWSQAGAEDHAEVLRLLECYVRWAFARGHPTHRRADLAWLRTAAPGHLFRVNNPALLARAYPDPDRFRQFAREQYGDDGRLTGRLPDVARALQSTRPRPIRLVTLAAALLEADGGRAAGGKGPVL